MAEAGEKLILIVEDDESIVDFLKYAIEKDGFRTNIARDGNQALVEVKASLPDLIVLDMMLPGKSGFEIIKALQVDEYRRIPIIVVTGRFTTDAHRSMAAMESNVMEYMTKPVQIAILMHKIHSLLGTMSLSEKKALDRGKEMRENIDPEGRNNF